MSAMKNNNTSAARILLTLAAFVVVIAGMRAAEAILVPFLLSVFIAVISAPPMFWLKRKGIPTGIAIVLIIAAIMAIGMAMGVLVGTSVDAFSRNLPLYQARLQQETAGLLGWLEGLGVALPEQALKERFDPGAAMKLVAGLLSGLSGVLTNAFFILVTVIFILMEASSFPAKLHRILNRPEDSLAHFRRFVDNLQRYASIKTLVSLATGIIIAASLWLLGVDFPLLWGLLAFLLNYVPNLGSIIAAVPAVLMAFIQLGSTTALLAALVYGVVNVVMGNIIEPRFMGRGLGLSTLVVFVSLVFWGWILGPVGMLLSVPLTMTLKIALEASDDTRWIAILLGPPEPEPEPPDTDQDPDTAGKNSGEQRVKNRAPDFYQDLGPRS